MSTLITRPTRSVPAYVQLEARALELASKAGRTELILRTGKGRNPTPSPPQPGCWSVAPFRPQTVQRAHCLSLSLDVSAPQRITGTAQASG